jgi:uncharacterized oxidoreductase
MKMSGNTVVITGATSGIGYAFAEEFRKLGNKVIICGRRENRLEEIRLKYPEIITRIVDMNKAKERESFAEWCIDNHPEVNVLINNAGVQLITDMRKPVDVSRVELEVETNFIAPVHLTSLFVQHFSTQPQAAIVNISSGLAFVPIAFMAVYCATKAAIHSLTLSLQVQLKHTPVKVFEIAPPAVDTELGHDRREDKTQSHGGMPVNEFIAEAIEALKNDQFVTAVGTSRNSMEKREALLDMINSRFPIPTL